MSSWALIFASNLLHHLVHTQVLLSQIHLGSVQLVEG